MLNLCRRSWSLRNLFWELSKREVAGRYSGSVMGLLWPLLSPLLMLAVYTLAFREFLGMRWPGASSGADFPMMVFAGLIVHGLFSECLMRAPSVMVGNAGLVTKVVFPLPILPLVTVAAAVFHALLGLLMLVAFIALNGRAIPLTALWLPLIYLPFTLLLCGVAWLMASLGTYFRDIFQLTGVLSAMLMFLSPVFYPASNLRPPYRSWLQYNPLTLIIEQSRAVLLRGQMPDWSALASYMVMAIIVMAVGYAWFQRTRDGFADVL